MEEVWEANFKCMQRHYSLCELKQYIDFYNHFSVQKSMVVDRVLIKLYLKFRGIT